MGFFRELRRRAGQVTGPVAGITMVIYFAYHAIQGDRGFIQLGKLEKQVATLEGDLGRLVQERQLLERRVSLLRPGATDPDMLEERARLVLGYSRPDELIIIDTPAQPPADAASGPWARVPFPSPRPAIGMEKTVLR